MELDLLNVLEHIDPSSCNYQEWTSVGMALKYEGYSWMDWDKWSQMDGDRYHSGECEEKWKTFEGNANPVTGGTIVQLAKDRGFTFSTGGTELDWDAQIGDEMVIIDKNWLEGKEIIEPRQWNPVQQLTTYLEVLFQADENVGYVTTTWQNDEGKYLPQRGNYDRTAGELIQQLKNCNGDIGAVIGDVNEEAGAWIRFNPLDGKDIKNDNVTDFRYALVESDSMDVAKQNAIMRELELPIAAMVYSGGKSVHAIVKIDAPDYAEYRKRVDYLYQICKKNGLDIDQQNRNPARLSRMPGVMRNGHKQFLIDINIGKENWNEWREWIESVNDDLPDPEELDLVWDDMPDLAPPLIENVLRMGHKMLIAGPSKAGKSFALIELTIAIAEGQKWMNWQCERGRVMYVNLELDRASCLHRFRDVYQCLGWAPNFLSNIDIWNLRGKSIPMDKLAPKLIRRASKKNYTAIIIDPIYKVITGDENSADQMANFCNQFDKICSELGCAVIYCHHHSKGQQGQKRSMDRASGSGVFARDPDALLDLIELPVSEDIQKQEINKAVCSECRKALNLYYPDWADDLSQDDCVTGTKILDYSKDHLDHDQFRQLTSTITPIIERIKKMTAWRIEGTLREFPKFEPLNLWFDYPVHYIDQSGVLKDIDPDEVKPPWQKGAEKRKQQAKSQKVSAEAALENAYNALMIDGEVTVKGLAEYLGITESGLRKKLNKSELFGFNKGKGIVYRKEKIGQE